MDSTGRDLGAASRGGALLGAGAALMVASGAWLAAADRPDGLLIAGVGLHLVLGLALLVPCAVWWWRRRGRPLVRLGGALLLASGAAGCLLLALGNRDALRPLLWTHAVLALAGLASLLAAVAPARRGPLWWAAAGGLLLAVLAPGMALAWRSWNPPGALAAANPAPSRDAAGAAMGGAAGPFYPTRASTRDGNPAAARLFLAAQSCGRSGCHADLTRQWDGSAHRFSGLDNPWYRATFAQMRQARGVTASRWCAGCHAPATLLSGAADGAPDGLAATPLGRAGVSCTVCHAISRVKGTTGQAAYELDTPALYRLALSDSALARDLYEVLLRIDPALHRRSFSRPFTASAELCSTCHSVRMDKAANGYHWFRVADDYRDWQVSSVSGQGYLLVTAFPPPRSCTDCHMPEVRSADAGGRQGRIHSHRFASANTAVPAWRGDAEQQAAVTSSLRSGAVTVDIFSMLEPPAAGAAGG
ncbi:MAG TPA: multiheme c-type cytochrome, partial [Thermoanaerobaculia bacterium]